MNAVAVGLLVLVGIAVVCDLRSGEIPDWIPLAILAWGCVAMAAGLHEMTWVAMGMGVLVGLGLSIGFFYLGGLGGGDVKLLAAIGAVVGPWVLLSIVAWMGVAGGLLALAAITRGKRHFAYGLAIAIGVALETAWPGGFAHVFIR